MEKNKIISEYSELRYLQLFAGKIFTGKEFPEAVFSNPEWGVYCLESWNIFNEETYTHFIDFINQITEEKIILAPDSFCKMNVEEYIPSLKEKDSKNIQHMLVLGFNSSFAFNEFNEFQEDCSYRSLDSYLFGVSGEWGIYVNTNIDLMVLGFSSSIKDFAEKYYKNYSERIGSIDSLLDEVDNWAKKDKIEKVKEAILLNYNKAFK